MAQQTNIGIEVFTESSRKCCSGPDAIGSGALGMVSGVGESAWIFFISKVRSGGGAEEVAACAVCLCGSVARMGESGGIKHGADEGSVDWAAGGRATPAGGAGGTARPANGRAGKRIRTVSDRGGAVGFGGIAIRTVFSLGSLVSSIRRAKLGSEGIL